MIKDLWYKNAVLYCLSVGTYMDANADGIGDFQGLMRRLDYLHGLGITAIWLMPFQKSPGKDDGSAKVPTVWSGIARYFAESRSSRSTAASISAPPKIVMQEIQIQVMKPTTAPSEP
jgi:hypothetical protein